MSEDRQQTAHALLAAAVDRVLNSEIPEAAAENVAHLELSLRNYRLAEVSAQAAPFSAMVNGALAQLDQGNPDGVRKFLHTMLGVMDFAPLVEVPIAPPAPSVEPFMPTHRHADGDVYQYLEDGWHKNEADGRWLLAAFYRGEDLTLRSTLMERWMTRFSLLEVDPAIV